MSKKFSWWFVSLVTQEPEAVRIDKLDADAVFADSPQEAIEAARGRNPLRPGQDFAVTKVSRREQKKAIGLHDERTSEIASLREILDYRCGLRDGS